MSDPVEVHLLNKIVDRIVKEIPFPIYLDNEDEDDVHIRIDLGEEKGEDTYCICFGFSVKSKMYGYGIFPDEEYGVYESFDYSLDNLVNYTLDIVNSITAKII